MSMIVTQADLKNVVRQVNTAVAEMQKRIDALEAAAKPKPVVKKTAK